MSGKNQKQSHPAKKANSYKPIAISQPKSFPGLTYVLLGIILVITYWCYHYSLGNEFTSWDDVRFITENIFIKSFSAANLKMLLFHVIGDFYNPLTMLSYAINYHFSGLTPQAYYLTNILIHLLNSCLMFFLVLMLLQAMERKGYGVFKWKEWLAFFCTLAYAVHPMHVESVSWIAERKDVLYAFFYFLGIMAYVKYIAKSEKLLAKSILLVPLSSYLLVLSLYLLSLLSKPMAVVFPFSLLAIDVLLKRDKTTSLRKLGLEKIPFIVVFIASAITTYYSQKSSGAVQEHQAYSFFQRVLFSSYDLYMYLLKAFVPLQQSSYYPYPDIKNGLPAIFYWSPFILLLVMAVPLYLSYRSGNNNFRIVLFGLAFYFFNIIIVSQLIGFGATLMSERYSYVCYLGVFFPLTCFVHKVLQKGELVKKITTVAVSMYMVFFAILCYERTFVWHNSETLWTDVANQYPHRVVEAYNSLGNYYFTHHNIEKAYANYVEAIDLKGDDPKVYCNMGILMRAKRQYNAALEYYTKSLEIDSNDAVSYADRAIVYSILGKYDLAIKDYRHSLSINPYSEALFGNIAFTYLNAKQFDSAINYYSRVIQINPANPGYFHYRGLAEFEKGAIKPAMDDFLQNLRIVPHDSECMFYLSKTYFSINDFRNAYQYAQLAKNAHYFVPDDYILSLKARLNER